MAAWVRRVAGSTIFSIVVLAAVASASEACSSDKPDDPPAVPLPSRNRRDPGETDASNVLQPADTGPIDTGPPADPFCLEPNLVLCFPFEGSITNDVTTPGKLFPAKMEGVTLVDGKKGKAAHFETGSVITFDHALALEMQAATVEAWVNRDLTTFGDDTVFDDGARFAMTVESDGTLRCSGANVSVKGGKVPIEQWVYIACTFDGTTITTYVAGKPVASNPGSLAASNTSGAAIAESTSPVGPGNANGFAGEIDSLRVFNIARPAAEIALSATP